MEARAAGVTAFCSKPMFMSDIRETLMAAIGQKQAEAEDNILPAADSDFRDRRILLVEDNELNSEIAVALLSEYGLSLIHIYLIRLNLMENSEEQQEWRKDERKKSDCRHSACGNFSNCPGRVQKCRCY